MTRSILVLMMLLPFAALADSGELSLAQALERAAATNPSIQLANLSVQQAEATLWRSAGAWDPTLTLGASTTYSESQAFLAGQPLASTNQGWGPRVGLTGLLPTGTSYSLSTGISRSIQSTEGDLTGGSTIAQDTWSGTTLLTLEQDLLAFARPTADRIARRTATEQRDQAALTASSTAQAALVEVANAWWAWSTAHASAKVAATAVEEAQALRDVTVARNEVGTVDGTEVARVEAELLQARIDQVEAQATVRSAADSLAVLVGVDPGAGWQPGDAGISPTLQGGLSEHVARALSANPDIALARAQVDAAEAANRDARLSRLPDLALTLSAGMGSLQDGAWDATSALFGEKGFPQASAGVSLAVPLGNRVARADDVRTEAAESAARMSLADLERRVEAQVRAAVDAVDTASQSLELARMRLEVARITEDGERARVDQGMLRLDELLSATRSRQDAEVAVLVAEQSLATSRYALAQLEGRMTPAIWTET